MCSSGDIKNAGMVLYGAPMDFTSSRYPGSRKGPDSIREESWNIESFSPFLKEDLDDRSFYDMGNVLFPHGDVPKALDNIEQVSRMLFGKNKKVLLFGGEHLVSYPVIKAATSFYSELIVIHFDAHADLRRSLYGATLSHASVMGLVAKECLSSSKKLYQFCIRSGTREEFEWAINNTNLYMDLPNKELLDTLYLEIGNNPVYISIDIDAFDPSVAPGTGTPEPGGITSREFFRTLYDLGRLNVIGMDIVEVSPMLDNNGITSLLGAKIARESILQWG